MNSVGFNLRETGILENIQPRKGLTGTRRLGGPFGAAILF